MKKFLSLIIMISIVAIGLYAYFILGNQLRAQRGHTLGRDYINKMYQEYSVAGESCQGEDSNVDSYITCNFRIKENATGYEKTIVLQCPTFWKSFLATNCKEQGITINQN